MGALGYTFLFLLQAKEKETDFQDFMAPRSVLSPLFTCFIGELGGVIIAPGSFEGQQALWQ